MNNWKGVWNKEDRISRILLEALISADGFDSGAGLFDVAGWLEYTQTFFDRLDIKEKQSIYDVGCGSGTFIYPLYLKGHKVGGADFSATLINLGNTIMKKSQFEVREASEIDTADKYDIVISHSVFHYFRDLEYAELVIKNMVEKARFKIAVLDLNDKSKQDVYHKTRMSGMTKEEYEKKYEGLSHMFYDKEWFVELGKKLGVKIDVFDQTFKKYGNSCLRFNVIMEKKI